MVPIAVIEGDIVATQVRAISSCNYEILGKESSGIFNKWRQFRLERYITTSNLFTSLTTPDLPDTMDTI